MSQEAFVIGGQEEVVRMFVAVELHGLEPHGKGWDVQPVVFFDHFPGEVEADSADSGHGHVTAIGQADGHALNGNMGDEVLLVSGHVEGGSGVDVHQFG